MNEINVLTFRLEIKMAFTKLLMWLILLNILSFRSVYSKKWISRQNYGVLLENIGVIDSGKSKWYQTFVVSLTKLDMQNYKHPCLNSFDYRKWSSQEHNITFTNHEPYWYTDVPDSDTVDVELFCPSFIAFERHHTFLKQRIVELQRRIATMLPHQSRRSKRGLFDFIGKIAKSLFGTATEDDIRAVRAQIAHMYATTADIKGQLVFLGNSLQSYIKKETREDEFLRHAILLQHKQNHLLAQTFTNSIKNVTNNLAFWINTLNIFDTDFSIYMNQIHDRIQKELFGVTKLFEGYLAPELVEPDLLKFTLSNIQKQLSLDSDFQISHFHPAFYYNRQDVTFVRIEDNIHITLAVPIHNEPTTYELYRLHSFPMPIPDKEHYFTVFKTTKPFLAVNEEQTLYITLSDSDYLGCTGSTYKQCHDLMSTLSVNRHSCELALYFGHQEQIHQLCRDQFQIVQNSQSFVAKIGNKFLLSTPDSKVTQICQNQTISKVFKCNFCELKPPCGCVMEGDSFYIPSRISQCENNSEIYINHSVNLPLLHEFYQEYDYLFNISSTQVYDLPVVAQIPEFQILEKKFDGVTQEAEKLSLSLKDTAKRIKQRNKIFRDKISQFSAGQNFITNYPLQIFLLVLLIETALIGHVALFCSVRNWFILYAMLHTTKAKSLVLGTTTPPDEQFLIEAELQSVLTVTSLTFCGFVLVVLIFLVWILSHCYSRIAKRKALTELPFNTTLYAVFYHAQDCVSVPLLVSCIEGKNLIAEELRPFSKTYVRFAPRLLTAELLFDWSFLKLQHKVTKAAVHLPRIVSITSVESAKFKSMNHGYSTIKLVGKQNGTYFELFSHESLPIASEGPNKFYENRALFTGEQDE